MSFKDLSASADYNQGHTLRTRRDNVAIWRVTCAAVLALVCAAGTPAQDTSQTQVPPPASPATLATAPTESIALTVPVGTPIQVTLDKEVRVQNVGQPIEGRTVEPVYAFDKLVIPVGTKVTGQITQIESVSNGKRAAAALDADFTPARRIHVEFGMLILADGQQIPLRTAVTPGSGQVIRFLTAADEKASKNGVKSAASEKTREAKEEARREWNAAMKEVKEPGKMRRIERYAVAQLPVHPQYIDAGTVYFAELQDPLQFGTEPLTPRLAASLNSPPPDGSFVHARLMTPLSSATSHKGDDVEAMLAQPLFDGDRLILPQGSLLKGSIIQVEPARHLSRNGHLRFVFHELVLPDGVQHKVDAILEAVQSDKTANVKLDSEGGAEAGPPKTRLLSTSISVGLGAISFLGDTLGDMGPRVAGGAGGYKLIGIALGICVHSQPLGMAMGAYGGTRSIYVHFIARGRDVAFPKNTAMEIGIGTRAEVPLKHANDHVTQQ